MEKKLRCTLVIAMFFCLVLGLSDSKLYAGNYPEDSSSGDVDPDTQHSGIKSHIYIKNKLAEKFYPIMSKTEEGPFEKNRYPIKVNGRGDYTKRFIKIGEITYTLIIGESYTIQKVNGETIIYHLLK